MATKRNKTDLQALHPDNTSNLITAGNARDVIESSVNLIPANNTDNQIAPITDVVGLSVKAVSGQTAHLIALYDSNGNLLSAINKDGDFTGSVASATNADHATTADSATTADTATTATSATSFTNPLVGDVTGTQGATTVATVGGATAANVAAATALANAATNTNTANAIVKRNSSGNFSANKVTGLAAPSGSTDAANQAYVDAQDTAYRTSWLKPCKAALVDAISAIPSGPGTYDDVALVAGDRVLVQTYYGIGTDHYSGNGTYTVTASGTWTRTNDLIVTGSRVKVQQGTIHSGTEWIIKADSDVDSNIFVNPYIDPAGTVSASFNSYGQLTLNASASGVSTATADTLVQRDANADFAANRITASLDGAADDVLHLPVMGKPSLNLVNYDLGSIADSPVNFDPAGAICITRGNSTGAIFPTGSGTFRGFPNLEVFPDGTLWIAYSVGSSHGAAGSITQYQKSTDNGLTWTDPVTIAPSLSGTPLSNSHLSSTGLIKSGTYKNRLFLTFWTDASTFTKVIWSDDFGATWSDYVNCYDTSTINGGAATWTTYVVSSTPLALADGSIIVGGYGHTSYGTPYVATCLRSTDGGATWNRLSVLYDGATSADADEQPEEPQIIMLNDGSLLCSIREDGGSSAVAVKGTIRFIKSTDSGATWTSLSKAYPGAFYGYGRPNICQTENGTVVCVTRMITSILSQGDGVIYTSHDNGATWDLYKKIDNRSWFYAYGDIKNCGRNQIAFAYAVQNQSFSRSDVCFSYILDGDGVSPFGGAILDKVRFNQITTGNPYDYTAPPTVAASNDATVLQTTVNNLVNYLATLGIGGSPLNCSSITGLWEADTISNTVNDLSGTFSSNTHLVSTGGADITPTTSGGSFAASSNVLKNTSPSGNNVIYWEMGAADGTYTNTFVWNGVSQAWCLMRVSGATTYLLATIDSTSCKLYKNVSGSLTLLSNPGLGGGDGTITCILTGANIVVKNGSTTVINHTLSAGDQATFLTPTKCGWYLPTTTDTVDNVTWHSDLITGSSISSLSDQSANTYNLTQGTLANQPTIYLANSTPGLFNEKPFLKFYNTQNMVTSSFTLQSQPNAYVGVFFFDVANSAAENIMRCKYGNSYNQALQVNAPAQGKKLSLYAGTATGTTTYSTNGVATPGGPYVISAYFNGASSYIRVNGKTVMRQDASNHIGSEGIDQFQIGDDNTGGAFLTPGFCVLAHGSPTLADIKQCELYFANKYNIRLALE